MVRFIPFFVLSEHCVQAESRSVLGADLLVIVSAMRLLWIVMVVAGLINIQYDHQL